LKWAERDTTRLARHSSALQNVGGWWPLRPASASNFKPETSNFETHALKGGA
jgi:hypothetical protein